MWYTEYFVWASAGAFIALVVQFFHGNWMAKRKLQRECPHMNRRMIDRGQFGTRYYCDECRKDWWE